MEGDFSVSRIRRQGGRYLEEISPLCVALLNALPYFPCKLNSLVYPHLPAFVCGLQGKEPDHMNPDNTPTEDTEKTIEMRLQYLDAENLDYNSSPRPDTTQFTICCIHGAGAEQANEHLIGKGIIQLPSRLTDTSSAVIKEERSTVASIEEELRPAHLKYDEMRVRHEQQISLLNLTSSSYLFYNEPHDNSHLEWTCRGNLDARFELLLVAVTQDVARLEMTLEQYRSHAHPSPSLSTCCASMFSEELNPAAASSPVHVAALFGSPNEVARQDNAADPQHGSDIRSTLPMAYPVDGLLEDLRRLSPARLREQAEGLVISNGLLHQARTFPHPPRASSSLILLHSSLLSSSSSSRWLLIFRPSLPRCLPGIFPRRVLDSFASPARPQCTFKQP